MTQQQLDEAEADANYWHDFIKGTGYTLYGFTGRTSATFRTPDKRTTIRIDEYYLDLIRKLTAAKSRKGSTCTSGS